MTTAKYSKQQKQADNRYVVVIAKYKNTSVTKLKSQLILIPVQGTQWMLYMGVCVYVFKQVCMWLNDAYVCFCVCVKNDMYTSCTCHLTLEWAYCWLVQQTRRHATFNTPIPSTCHLQQQQQQLLPELAISTGELQP